jgi:hypothetical protein
VCPDRRVGRQKHDDRQKTGKGATVGNINFHTSLLHERTTSSTAHDSQLRWFGQCQ